MKDGTYITIQSFMVKELHLKGNELYVYAIIYGFSQDGESKFTGSISYLSNWLGVSRQTIMSVLQKLVKQNLIIKNNGTKNNVKYCTYHVNLNEKEVAKKFDCPIQKSLLGVVKKINWGSQKSLLGVVKNFDPIIYLYTINNKLIDKYSLEYETIFTDYPKQKEKEIGKMFYIILREKGICFQAFLDAVKKYLLGIEEIKYCKQIPALLTPEVIYQYLPKNNPECNKCKGLGHYLNGDKMQICNCGDYRELVYKKVEVAANE